MNVYCKFTGKGLWVRSVIFTLFQVCVKYDPHETHYLLYYININWIRKIFNIDILRKVYFYDCGKIELLGLQISDSLYRKAMDYVTERQIKNEEFLKKISELQEITKNQLNDIVQETYDSDNRFSRVNSTNC